MKRTTALAATALVLLSASTPALAHPAAPEPGPLASLPAEQITAPAPRTEDYGWHILLTDLAVLSAGVASAGVDDSGEISSTLFWGGYLGGAPIVHLTHGNPRGAIYSFGLRLTAPMAGVAIGLALEDCSEGEFLCPLGGMVLGGALGMLSASVIDAAVLAEREIPAERDHLWRVGGVGANPVVSATGDRAFVGLAGAF